MENHPIGPWCVNGQRATIDLGGWTMARGWMRVCWGTAIAVLLATAAALVPASVAGAVASAPLDPLLQAAVASAQPADRLPVVVQLDHVPSALDVKLLKSTGAEVVPFTSL